jgi:hypothetical protein
MTKELKVSKIQQWLNDQQKMLDRSIVATPTEEVLDMFAQSNHGVNDFLLMQMAKNYGYQLALDHLTEQL